jgi:uncharacterized protein
MNALNLQAIPAELQWGIPPQNWNIAENKTLTMTAGAKTDLFISPEGDVAVDNSARALFIPQGDFLLSARVQVDFRSTYDAGVLMLYANAKAWAKLCFEFSPQRQPMVVSVVNHGVSDDCNSTPIAGNQVYLRIARRGSAFVFHYSVDGTFWHFVRFFTLAELPEMRVGFSVQAPTGELCTATFSEITYTQTTLKDLRNGE